MDWKVGLSYFSCSFALLRAATGFGGFWCVRWIGEMLLHAHNVLLMTSLVCFLVYQYVTVQLWGMVSKVCPHWQHPMNGHCHFSRFGRLSLILKWDNLVFIIWV
jgi:hypothetical protein